MSPEVPKKPASAVDSASAGLQSAIFKQAPTPVAHAVLQAMWSSHGAMGTGERFEPTAARVMMVDDEPLNVDMTQAFLEDAGFSNFVSTSDSTEAVELMRKQVPHVLLLDLAMPGRTGLEILEDLQDDKVLCHVPVIVLTSSTERQIKMRALELGAMEFLHKPVDPSELALRLRNTLAARAHQEYLANHDSLTGLANGHMLEACLQSAIERAGSGRVAVLAIGVDQFIQIREALGRQGSDIMLRRLARRLMQCVETEIGGDLHEDPQDYPTLYRVDGDEFAVLVPAVEQMEVLAAFISRLIESAGKGTSPSDFDLNVTCSVGVAVFPHDGAKADEVLNNATLAMRQASLSGGNTFGFYSAGMQEQARAQFNLRAELRRDMLRGDVDLMFLPTVSSRSGRLVGIEAVLQWEVNDRVLDHEQTMEVARQAGLAMSLYEWITEQVVRVARGWAGRDLRATPIGLNLSMQHMPVGALQELLDGAVRQGADPATLRLELNEASLAEFHQRDLRALADLKEQGFGLVLDDFAAARGSIAMMAGGRFNEVKLHAGLVADVFDNPRNAAICKAALALAASLSIPATATGVTSPRHVTLFRSLGCERCQGPMFGAPLAAAAFAQKWLVSKKDADTED